MTDSVGCAQCGTSYDSEEHPFCPHCGALERASSAAPALALADREHPRRRRTQVLGIAVASIGVVVLLFVALAAISITGMTGQVLEVAAGEPGGALAVQVLAGGAPAPEVSVQVTDLAGDLLAQAMTDETGWANFTDLAYAGVEVYVQYEGDNWTRRVLTLRMHTPDNAPQVRIDVASDPHEVAGWVGAGQMRKAVLVLVGVLGVLGGLTVAGGVAGARLRNPQLAVAGSGAGAVPWLLLGMLSWVLLGVAMFLVFAAVRFFRGRAHFKQ